MLIHQWRNCLLCIKYLAVFAAVDEDFLKRFATLDGFPEVLIESPVMQTGLDQVRFVPYCFSTAVTGDPFKRRINVFNDPLRIGNNHSIVSLRDDAGVHTLLLQGLHSFGNVRYKTFEDLQLTFFIE